MKVKFIIGLVLFVLFFSCETDEVKNDFIFGREERFVVNKEYISNDQSLKFSISEINDSRCPADVQCVWQGEALVAIKIVSSPPSEITLSTYDNLVDTVGIYSMELVDVSPYPLSTETLKDDDYTINLKIDKLAQ